MQKKLKKEGKKKKRGKSRRNRIVKEWVDGGAFFFFLERKRKRLSRIKLLTCLALLIQGDPQVAQIKQLVGSKNRESY